MITYKDKVGLVICAPLYARYTICVHVYTGLPKVSRPVRPETDPWPIRSDHAPRCANTCIQYNDLFVHVHIKLTSCSEFKNSENDIDCEIIINHAEMRLNMEQFIIYSTLHWLISFEASMHCALA